VKPDYLTEEAIDRFIETALHEDIGDGDHSTLSAVPADTDRQARLIIKDNGILAGIEMAVRIFRKVNPNLEVQLHLQDGQAVKEGDIAFAVKGKAQSILHAERLVLNCMQRMSGIATLTQKAVDACYGTSAQILDTRKTTPNFRLAEKWAVIIGGGKNHRFGLFDMIMLKDNHVDYAGGVKEAIDAADEYRKSLGKAIKIEIETRNLQEVRQAVETGKVDVIMLDNMNPNMMSKAVKIVNKTCLTEASGKITLTDISKVADCGVDFISMGALTHSARILDMSLKAF